MKTRKMKSSSPNKNYSLNRLSSWQMTIIVKVANITVHTILIVITTKTLSVWVMDILLSRKPLQYNRQVCDWANARCTHYAFYTIVLFPCCNRIWQIMRVYRHFCNHDVLITKKILLIGINNFRQITTMLILQRIVF